VENANHRANLGEGYVTSRTPSMTSFIEQERIVLVPVLPVIATQLSFTFLSVSNDFLQYGTWMYLVGFVIVLLGSTVVGGLIPNNTFVFLSGAVAHVNGFSMEWLFLLAVMGAFAGYEINYWHGRLFENTILLGVYKTALQQRNVRKAFDMMEDFSIITLVVSRVMPVLNLPSFLAGADRMNHRTFVGFNLVSSLIWSLAILVLGYFFGGIPVVSKYLNYFVVLLIIGIIIITIIALIVFARRYMTRNDTISTP
jgi:membrane-associated protein